MFKLIALAAIVAANLEPGLNAPVTDGAARLDAAVLASTNASATASVAAVYELPVYGWVESAAVVTNDYLTLSTNVVVGTNRTDETTGLYTLATNPTDRVTSLYTVTTNAAGIAATNYLYIATNYFRVWTNSWPVMVNSPRIETVTNRAWQATGSRSVTNDLFTLAASGGFAETNGVNRWISAPARLLLVGEPVTVILTR